jgi:hypothetical protein
MGRTIPTFRDFVREWSGECLRMLKVLPDRERTALKSLLDTVLSRSDAGSLMSSPLPSETALMLMIVSLKAELDDLRSALKERNS